MPEGLERHFKGFGLHPKGNGKSTTIRLWGQQDYRQGNHTGGHSQDLREREQ